MRADQAEPTLHGPRCRAPVLPLRRIRRFNARTETFSYRWRMTLYTLGPNENKDGPFAEVHARNELEARKKVQSVDNRRNWFDLGAVYCVPIERLATPYVAGEVRIFEKLVDQPPA